MTDRRIGARRTAGICLAVAAAGLAWPGGTVVAAAPKTVGKVAMLGGTKQLQVRDGRHLRKLREGDRLALRQTLVVGKGASATLTLKRPRGVSAGTDLIRLTPAKGTQPTILTSRSGSVITVKITPTAASALAVAAAGTVKRGTYIEVTTQTYIATNAAATKIASLNIGCMRDGQQVGSSVIAKPLRIANGRFAYDGTARTGDASIRIAVTGRFVNGRITGQIGYPDASAPCAARAFSAKYYGVNPQG